MPRVTDKDIFKFIEKIHNLSPIDTTCDDELERRLKKYLALCIEHDQPITNLTAYAAIGIDRKTAYEWQTRRSHGGINNSKVAERRYEFITRLKGICACFREQLMLEGLISPELGIFWQCQYDGLSRTGEIKITNAR